MTFPLVSVLASTVFFYRIRNYRLLPLVRYVFVNHHCLSAGVCIVYIYSPPDTGRQPIEAGSDPWSHIGNYSIQGLTKSDGMTCIRLVTVISCTLQGLISNAHLMHL